MEIYEMENESSGKSENIKQKSETKITSLTNNQKSLILNRWNDDSKDPPSIDELLKLIFPNKNLDGRSKEGILVKTFLVENNLKSNIEPKILELSEEQKEYITTNCSTMKPMEMARVLFNPKISPGSSEVKLVVSFLKTIDPKILYGGEVPEDNYSAPKTVGRVVSRIKKYVEETKDWDAEKLSANQKKQVEALTNYLSSFRFKYQIDSYENRDDKELFESSFIKYTYDKNDLSQENCDQYILLCSEVVISSSIQKTINLLEREQDRALEEDGKISMAVVEAIKTARTEHNDCVKRQQALYKSLTQERSDRLNDEIKDKASLLNLINAWKSYESRQRMLKLAGEKKDNLRKELHELETLDEMKMKILGLSVDEILNG